MNLLRFVSGALFGGSVMYARSELEKMEVNEMFQKDLELLSKFEIEYNENGKVSEVPFLSTYKLGLGTHTLIHKKDGKRIVLPSNDRYYRQFRGISFMSGDVHSYVWQNL